MSEYITKIRTNYGDKQIDYRALANLPQSDTTLSQASSFADAKTVGDKIQAIESSKADKTYVEDAINAIQGDKTLTIDGAFADAKVAGDKFQAIESSKADKTYVDEEIQKAKEDTENIDQAVASLHETINNELSQIISIPASGTSDNGKFLRVVDGVAAWAAVPNAEESGF